MNQATDVLLSFRRLFKLHEQYLEKIRLQYGLTQMEIKIISFLHNNPGRDTAGDICELRMLPKGNVSQGVESLIQKGFLTRHPDRVDRRRIHLHLTEAALPIVAAIAKAMEQFRKQIFAGFTPEEMRLYHQFNNRLLANTNTRKEEIS